MSMCIGMIKIYLMVLVLKLVLLERMLVSCIEVCISFDWRFIFVLMILGSSGDLY